MLVTLKDIKKIIGGSILFEKLNVEIKPGEKVGLVGRNGSGKTTIFKLIVKQESFEEGDLFIKKGTKIGYLKQVPQYLSGTVKSFLLSGLEELLAIKQKMENLETKMQEGGNLEQVLTEYGKVQEAFTAAGGYEMDAQLEKVANGLGIGHLINLPFSSLSGGEKTKAGLARILLQNPDLLLLDEPTNHLDLAAIEWLEQYIANYQGAVCVVSHDRNFLDHSIEKIIELENGEADYYKGNYSQYVRQKEAKLLSEFAAFQEQQRKIKKMKETIKRLKQWANQANPPNEGLHKRARNMERALERMEIIERPEIDPDKMKLTLQADHRSGKDVIKAEAIFKQFSGRTILRDLDLHLRYQDRLAIVGDNGSGKSTLMKILLGELTPDRGRIAAGTQLQIGYLSQQPIEEAEEEKRLIDKFREEVSVSEGQARGLLANFMFYGFSVFKRLGQLSGGERMRLKLAVFMHRGVNVLFLDEPTNHLDMESQEVLEEALAKFKGTVLCISHDRYFLNKCFPETAYLVDGKLDRMPGTYQETNYKWKQWKESTARKETTPSNQNTPISRKTVDYEGLILELEEKLAALTQRADLSDGQFKKEKQQIEEKIEACYAAWLE
ncbi:ribosomal protection-like ABC-F family protein [Sediminibacillus halophilus]|uniref:ATPase components of ABC transporters with duplicated ATPase domains n=1 Tax=Sediminibacillus halophilus TaxID=482461 RepID=A0A1G9WS14_9BACI|nr:ABC-F family ATP-binding cassette domain-containing protein [Sediminibacillus halophilus]SDM87237.1 ATPase components of ABC transporters with duplicated ATPase domains [Sediminibacillus halophilus]